MDAPLQRARREGDPLRAARLLRRAGQPALAFDLLAPLWRESEGELRRTCALELEAGFAELERAEQLERAGELEALERAGCARAGRALAAALPAARLLAGAGLSGVRAELYRLASQRAPLLIWGEHGTGHTLSARALHALGGGPRESFCELYGRNGARRMQRELSALPLGAGATLYLSYANETERWVDWIPALCRERGARLVVGMHTGVPQELELEGRRLVSVGLPPLRERLEDLGALVHALLGRAGVSDPAAAAPSAVLRDLAAHDWPGNVRELANHVARAVHRSSGEAEIQRHLVEDVYGEVHGLPGEVGS